MSARNWPTPTPGNPGQWFSDTEKRMRHQESQPVPKVASDLLGPGLAAHAVRLADWNSPEANFNGFWYSFPGDLHSPDSTLHWIGETVNDGNGFGIQKAWNHREGVWPSIAMVRNVYDPGAGGVPQYGEWVSQSNLEPSLQDMTSSMSYPGSPAALPGLERTLQVRSFADRFLITLSASIRCEYPGTFGTVGLDVGATLDTTRLTPIVFGVTYGQSTETVDISIADSDSDTSPVVGGPGTVTVTIDIADTDSDTVTISTDFDIRLQQSRQWMVGPLTPGEHTIGAFAGLNTTAGDFTVFAPHTQMSIIKVA